MLRYCEPREVAAIGSVLFGVIGAAVGYFTDFTRSTVYKVK